MYPKHIRSEKPGPSSDDYRIIAGIVCRLGLPIPYVYLPVQTMHSLTLYVGMNSNNAFVEYRCGVCLGSIIISMCAISSLAICLLKIKRMITMPTRNKAGRKRKAVTTNRTSKAGSGPGPGHFHFVLVG
jgi:hypothetical protein